MDIFRILFAGAYAAITTAKITTKTMIANEVIGKLQTA